MQINQDKKNKSEFQLFGSVSVPLGGLLGTENLDALVTCELEADRNTLASVVGRAQILPKTSKNSSVNNTDIGTNLGKVSMRISLVGDVSQGVGVREGESVGVGVGVRVGQGQGQGQGVGVGSKGVKGSKVKKEYKRGEWLENDIPGRSEVSVPRNLLVPVPVSVPVSAPSQGQGPVPVSVISSVVAGNGNGKGEIVQNKKFENENNENNRSNDNQNIANNSELKDYNSDDDPLHLAMNFIPSEKPRKSWNLGPSSSDTPHRKVDDVTTTSTSTLKQDNGVSVSVSDGVGAGVGVGVGDGKGGIGKGVGLRGVEKGREVGVGVGGVGGSGGQVGLTNKPVKAFLGVVVRGILGLDVGALQPNIQPKPLNSPHRYLSSPASPSAPSSSSFSISSSATASPSFSTSNLKVETEGVLLSRITISYKLSMYEKEELHGPWILTDSVLTQGTGSGNNSMVRQLYCN